MAGMAGQTGSDGTELLAGISGGRVLDAATGSGRFIVYLRDRLKDFSEIVGIDVDEGAVEPFRKRLSNDPHVRFMAMDARRLEFPARSFDTASIAHALCEFDDPLDVLAGLVRVVRQGGNLIVAESFREQDSEPTMNAILLHDWWVAVEALAGAKHCAFRRRTELVQDLNRLGLSELQILDVPTDQTDPWEPEMRTQLDGLAERYLALAAGNRPLQERGAALMQRVHDTGFLPATALLAVGRA